jgi:hypothetical protein
MLNQLLLERNYINNEDNEMPEIFLKEEYWEVISLYLLIRLP